MRLSLKPLTLVAVPMALCTSIVLSNLPCPDALAPQGPAERASPTRAAALLADEHHCWTGEAPEDMQGKLPGHVVVTTRAGHLKHTRHLVGAALDQVFDGADHGLTVHAFCR